MTDARIQEIQALLPQGMLPDWVRLGSRLVRLLRDRRHPAAHDAILDRLLEQARASVALREERRLHAPRVSHPPELPITSRKDDIIAAIRAHQVVVIAGETGSGKTTQIPKMCLEAGLGIEAKIGCTQPRRVAALSISRRIADELGAVWGREVGCKIRFDDQSSERTYIKLMTDGILLAETQGDPLLSEYNAIIIDEAHERSLNIDFLLGYLKGLLAKRPDLKLIITSATIDTQAFSAAFNHAPIIEVSGRTYPVHVVYEPFDAESEERGELTYIDAAVRAAENVLCEPGNGDVLVFMPGEKDIRETSDQLAGRFGREAEVIPLFGRLSAGDQQRVFAPSPRRKIIIATNIAETSLTLPGIRYVIDTGLARISRYTARTRTKRLPVEEISQSSANQRKGRAGRVQDGICIRLYSEENFKERPAFTQPEIQRANLAEVILRMKAFRLGDIETFPFVNPPPPAAIAAGYSLLQELGALDEKRDLTDLGRDLARLPIDPTLGRMLLQSQKEHATRELLIIASGLSIQDPRERPLDQKAAAEAAHKRWSDPQSDFLTLLKIWNAVHDQWETLRGQSQRRKFCKANFLSYLRFKEWQDLYAQLHGALEDLRSVKLNESNAAYDAIHRSILAGLLGHVATRKERNAYAAMGNRQVTIFPGSSLYDKQEKPAKPAAHAGPLAGRPAPVRQPQWIVAGELVETSQLFARTVAGIDPLWIIQLAPHLCKITHQNPKWDVKMGSVLADEKTSFNGMELRQRKVAYGNIAPEEATEIFIRAALVEEDLLPDSRRNREGDEDDEDNVRVLRQANAQAPALPPQYSFIEHNRQVRHKIETWQTRVRRHDLKSFDQILFELYARHLKNVSSVPELNRWLREDANRELLRLNETDLTAGLELHYDQAAFPDAVPLDGQPVAVTYAYAPGEEQDGATVKLGFSLAQTISQASVEWSVPGLREGQINELLRALPKSIRRELMPFPPKVEEIARELRPQGESLKKDLALFIRQRYGVEVPLESWPADAIPQHLRPRIEVVDNDQKILGSSRDLNQLRQRLEKAKVEPTGEDPAWERFAGQWEQFGLTAWSFGNLPERITISAAGKLPLYGWPGIQAEEQQVSLRLFRTQESARRASREGCRRLVSLALSKDLAWLHKDMRSLSKFAPMTAGWLTAEELAEAAFENLRNYLLPSEAFSPLTEAAFNAAVGHAQKLLPGLSMQMADRLGLIFKLRQEICVRCKAAPPGGVAAAPVVANKPRVISDFRQLGALAPPPPVTNRWLLELNQLMPPDFLLVAPYAQLPQFPRYLKALQTRMERAALNPAKDQERAKQLAPYAEALRKHAAAPPSSPAGRRALGDFRWMVEEFKVSLFAQELGTAFPISAQRLNEQLKLIS